MIRHSVEKSFSKCKTSVAVVYFNQPLSIVLRGNVKPTFPVAKSLANIQLENKPLAEIETDLSSYDYIEVATEMFSGINPNTGITDVEGTEFYAETVPLGVMGGIITPQIASNGETFFNGDGTVTIAEVLDGFNAIENGANSNKNRVKSLDNVSDVSDYFNEGYNRLCKMYCSIFYNLYQRNELFRPITRLELAYLTVVCSDQFDSVFSNIFDIGITFDWMKPAQYISNYKDWSKYKVSLYMDGAIPSNNIKDYKGSRTVTEFLEDIKTGKSAIPLPMIMSMVELGVQGLFYYKDMELCPLREVTRGELCYFFTKLVKGAI